MTLPGSNDEVDDGLISTHLVVLSLRLGERASIVEEPDILSDLHLFDEAEVHQWSSWNLHVKEIPSELLESSGKSGLSISVACLSGVVW